MAGGGQRGHVGVGSAVQGELMGWMGVTGMLACAGLVAGAGEEVSLDGRAGWGAMVVWAGGLGVGAGKVAGWAGAGARRA